MQEKNSFFRLRHYSIQGWRFVFSIMIVNYHFFSLFLRFNENLPNFFCRSYLADEFFFMVSGFFIAQSVMEEYNSDSAWTLRYIIKRINKIAIPYYSSWLLCFAGGRIADAIAGEEIRIIPNLLNSVYELLFLEMLGFNKGLYSNSVGWYFSALIISILLICPLLKRLKNDYILFFAPIIGAFGLGMLSLQYDYLFWPSKIIPGVPILKGMVRAYLEVNLGVFVFGLYKISEKKQTSRLMMDSLRIINCLLWVSIIFYMIIPFKSNFDEPTIQYDYIFTILIFIALIMTFFLSPRVKMSDSRRAVLEKLGNISVYLFFGQPIIYTLHRWYFSLPLRVIIKYGLFIIIIFGFSFLIYCIDICVKKRRVKRNRVL